MISDTYIFMRCKSEKIAEPLIYMVGRKSGKMIFKGTQI